MASHGHGQFPFGRYSLPHQVWSTSTTLVIAIRDCPEFLFSLSKINENFLICSGRFIPLSNSNANDFGVLCTNGKTQLRGEKRTQITPKWQSIFDLPFSTEQNSELSAPAIYHHLMQSIPEDHSLTQIAPSALTFGYDLKIIFSIITSFNWSFWNELVRTARFNRHIHRPNSITNC